MARQRLREVRIGALLALFCMGCGCAAGAQTGHLPVVYREPPVGSCKRLWPPVIGRAEVAAGASVSEAALTERARDDLSLRGAEVGATHIHEVAVRTTPPTHPTKVEVEGVGYRCAGEVSYTGVSKLGATDPRATLPARHPPGPAPAPPPRPQRPPPPPIRPAPGP